MDVVPVTVTDVPAEPPNETVAPAAKLKPVIVTTVPPATAPEVGVIAVMPGTKPYMLAAATPCEPPTLLRMIVIAVAKTAQNLALAARSVMRPPFPGKKLKAHDSTPFGPERPLGYPHYRVPAFPQTHRSVLERVRAADADVRRAAFGALADGYWRPSYHYLRLQWRMSPDDAEDTVQAFFTTAFEKKYLEKFDPAKARFRTFLRTCLDRFVQNDRKAETALKRGGPEAKLSLDFSGAEHELARHLIAPSADPDAFFRAETIRALCARAIAATRVSLETAGRARARAVFERHDLVEDEVSYADVAAALGLTVAQVTNDLHFARRLFRECALVELRAMAATDDEYRADARDLFGFEVPR